MISSAQVRSDSNQIGADLSSFYSNFEAVNTSWRGSSFDSLHMQAQSFVDEYGQVVASQMDAFAQAVDLYQQYLNAKTNFSIADGNVNLANSYNRIGDANAFHAQAQDFLYSAEDLKNQIISLLGSINRKLEASSDLFITAADGSKVPLGSTYSVSNASGEIEFYMVRYTGEGKEGNPNPGTTVWYAVIPKEMMPKMAMANDDLTKVGRETITNMAKDHDAKLGINLSVDEGMMYTDGTLVRENNIDYGETLIMRQDGTLESLPNSQYSTQDILDLNPVWATKGFFAICRDGEFISQHDDAQTSYIVDIRHPRTFIGQDTSGNYIVGVCTGRANGEAGMYMEEIYDFVKTNITPDIRILYNGDGGGSSSFVYDGKKQNPNLDEGAERARPNMIYW